MRAAAAVAVRLFWDANKLFLEGGQMYRLENPDQMSVRLKVEHSVFGTLDKQRYGSKFVEEVSNLSDSELRCLTQSCIYISVKLMIFFPKPQ